MSGGQPPPPHWSSRLNTKETGLHGPPGGNTMTDLFRGQMQSRRLRVVLLVCSAALALVPIVPAYLPLVDFPQHVALHAIWNNIADPAFHLNGRFRVTLSTPYALPHLAAHAAARFLGPEGGLRAVLVMSLVGFPLAALVLLREFDRPPEIALAAFPAALSFVYWYGFVSYVMALPLILLGRSE